MSTLGDLSINAKITVSDETAWRCIELLNIYLADNPSISIDQVVSYSADGKPFASITIRHNCKEG